MAQELGIHLRRDGRDGRLRGPQAITRVARLRAACAGHGRTGGEAGVSDDTFASERPDLVGSRRSVEPIADVVGIGPR
jgi:hypothetical protein